MKCKDCNKTMADNGEFLICEECNVGYDTYTKQWYSLETGETEGLR